MAKKSFPDLTGDGKVTQADILKGKGVKGKKAGGMAKKGYASGGKVKKKGFNMGGIMPPASAGGRAGGMKTKMAELKKRADAGDPQAKAELAKMMAAQGGGGGAPAPAPAPAKPMGMKKGGMAKKGYANGGVAKKNGKKATKSKGKVRGAGIAKKGVRKCKMR